MVERRGSPKEPTPPWEWALAAVSAVLVFGSIAFLAWEAIGTVDTPPQVTVTVDSIAPAGAGHLVLVRVSNHGTTTASRLQIEGELAAPGGPERSVATVEHLPAAGHRRAGLYFTNDPRRYPLRLRPVGFDLP